MYMKTFFFIHYLKTAVINGLIQEKKHLKIIVIFFYCSTTHCKSGTTLTLIT